MNKLKM